MNNIKINDKSYNIPSSFEELTLGEYCDIFYNLTNIDDIDDEAERKKESIKRQSVILSRILHEDDDFALELPITLYTKLFDMTKWIYNIEQYQKLANNELKVDGITYHIKDVSKLSTRQYIDVDETLKEKTNKNLYCDVLAIIIQDKYKGEYKELSNKVKQLNCNEALPIVFFSFIQGKRSQAISQISSQLKVITNQLQSKIEDSKKNING